MKRLTALSLLLLFGCDKDTKAPEPPAVAQEGEPTEPAPAEPEVPQEPAPPQVAEGAHKYLTGHYDEAVAILEPVYLELKEKGESHRAASGEAAGWLALAHAQIVFENAEEPSQHASAMAGETSSPAVDTLAKLAHGAFLLGNEDYAAAAKAFESGAADASGSVPAVLAQLLYAEALIGSAFGSGASEEVQNPADLEKAKQAYERAASAAGATAEADILRGRAAEGLAAVAKYQGDKTALCQHAKQAVTHYETAGVSEFLLDGPRRLVSDSRC